MATETNNVWGQNKQGVDLTVPSGQTCKARRPGMDAFIREGLIPNNLLPIVRKAMSGKDPDYKEFLEGMDDNMLEDIVRLVDAITIKVVVEPPLFPIPADPAEQRFHDRIYVDDVDFEDKMFIFQWAVGGTADLERFRAEQRSALATVPSGADVERPAEQPSGD